MKTKSFKYLKIIIIALSLVMAFTVTVHADFWSDAADFITRGSSVDTHDADIEQEIVPIGQILVHIGGWVLVISTVIVGIKYILSTPEERAKLKTQLYGLVFATFVIYGGQALWAALVKTFESVT